MTSKEMTRRMIAINHIKKRFLTYSLLIFFSVIAIVGCVSNPFHLKKDILDIDEEHAALTHSKNWAAYEAEPQTHGEIDYTNFMRNYLTAQLFEYEGELAEASIHYSLASKAYPSQTTLREKAFSFALLSGDWDNALNFATLLTAEETSLTLAYMTTIAEHLRQNNWEQAQTLLTQKIKPLSNIVHFQIAQAYLQLTQGASYTEITAQIRDLPYSSALSPMKHYHLGRIFELYGDLTEAEMEYTLAYEQDTKSVLVARTLLSLLHKQGKQKKINQILADFEERSPENVSLLHTSNILKTPFDHQEKPLIEKGDEIKKALSDIFFNFATLLSVQHADVSSRQMINIALAINPQNTSALFYKALLLEEQGDYSNAHTLYTQIPEKTDAFVPAQLRIVGLYQEKGDKEKAIQLIKTLESTYKKSFFRRILAELYLEEDDYKQAIHLYTALLEEDKETLQSKKERARTYFARGSAYERLKQYDTAQKDLEKALTLDPKNPIALNYLGYLLVDREKDIHRGLKLITQALTLRPHDAAILDSMGWAWYKLGDIHKAVSFLEKAVSYNPKDATIHMHLGDAYFQAKQHGKAKSYYQKALDMGLETEEDQSYIYKKLKKLTQH